MAGEGLRPLMAVGEGLDALAQLGPMADEGNSFKLWMLIYSFFFYKKIEFLSSLIFSILNRETLLFQKKNLRAYIWNDFYI